MKITLSFLSFFVASSFGQNCLKNRILGGTSAAEKEFPYQVALFAEGFFRCGGVIIDELHVLTAADCLKFDP
jgi:secreted trypsin-like serine protease